MERRRGRKSKIEIYGAEKIVDPLLAEGKTYKEVAEAFERETGEKIALGSLREGDRGEDSARLRRRAQQPPARGHP